jgi:sugar phosphate isomerase/epimerase
MRLSRRALFASSIAAAAARAAPRTKMTIELSPGPIGVKGAPPQIAEYAQRFGFESVEVDSGFLAALDDGGLKRYLEDIRARGLVLGHAGLPVDFRRGADDFQKGLRELPRRAAALQRAGVARVGTWISPGSDDLTFTENLRQHARRLRHVALILADCGIRFGLEYVGPKTSWTARRFPFIHTMRETKELIAEIGAPNVGFVLDSWHWHTARETVDDLKTLQASDVVLVDLNDAPAGIPVDEQIDSARELPCATGVIDLAGFLNALNTLGCDAPVRCEPFNARLRAMPPEEALQATADAMRKAFALIR